MCLVYMARESSDDDDDTHDILFGKYFMSCGVLNAF